MSEIEEIVARTCNKEGILKRCPARTAQALTEAGYRKEKDVAAEILSIVGNIDDGDGWTKLKDYQWFTDLCQRYGVVIA